MGEQEGRKKDGDRDVQELKEVTGRLILGEALFLLQCHQQKLGRCCEHHCWALHPPSH